MDLTEISFGKRLTVHRSKMRALGASEVAAIAKARALICERPRRALVDAQIRDICDRTGNDVLVPRKALHDGRAAVKRALKDLGCNNCSMRERTTRARLAHKRVANALFPDRRAAPSLRYDFAAATSSSSSSCRRHRGGRTADKASRRCAWPRPCSGERRARARGVTCAAAAA